MKIKSKQLLSALLVVSMLFGLFVAMPLTATAEDGITMVFTIEKNTNTINGTTTQMDVSPVIIEDRTLLPIRFAAEPLGAVVEWDGSNEKVTVRLMDIKLELWIGQSNAVVNGVTVAIDPENTNVKPLLISDRTMLPLRFVTENLGCDVAWDGDTQQVTITKGTGEDEDDGGDPWGPSYSLDDDLLDVIEGGNPDTPPIADEIPISEGDFKQKLINLKADMVASIPKDYLREIIVGIKVPTATRPSPLTNAISAKETGTDYLGRGYDVVIGGFADAEYFSELSVLDINKLLKDGQIGKMVIDNSKGTYFSGETVHKYAESRATSVNVKAKYMLFKAGVSNAFSSSQFSESGHSYSSIVYRAPLYALYINPALEDFTEYFTDDFKKSVRDLFDQKISYEKFLQFYGSHMVRSVIMGGRIEHNVSTNYKYSKSESQRQTDVHASFNSLFASASISVSDGKTQMSESFQSNHEEKTIASPAYGFPTLDGAHFDAWFHRVLDQPGL